MGKSKRNRLRVLITATLVLGNYGAASAAGLGKTSGLIAQNGATSGNLIYYGAYKQDADAGDYKKGTDGRYQGVAYKVMANGTTNNKVVVMAEKIVDAAVFRADRTAADGYQWAQSDIYKQLNTNTNSYLNTAFSSKETGLITDSTITTYDDVAMPTPEGTETTQKIYLLSSEEAAKYFGTNPHDWVVYPEQQAKITDYAVTQAEGDYSTSLTGDNWHWWLRTPGSIVSELNYQYVDSIGYDGMYTSGGIPDFVLSGVRPVLQLNLESVLFTSVAANDSGKAAATVGGGFITPTEITPTSAVKLTVRDEYDAANNTSGQQKIKTITVNDTANLGMKYTIANAYTGDKANKQVIAGLIGNTGYSNWTSYAHMASIASGQTEGAGTAAITAIGLADGTYGLSLYSEQANDWDKTDYAGAVKDIFNISVKKGAVDELVLQSTAAADPLTVDSESGVVTLEEAAYNQDLTAQNSGTYKIRDGKDMVLNGSLILHDGIIDMTKTQGATVGSYNTLTVNNLVGTGSFLLDTDFANETGDKLAVHKAAAGAGGTIQVYDASLVTGNKVMGEHNLMLVQDGSGATTWTSKNLDTGGLWEIIPTVKKEADDNWYLTNIKAKPNPSTAAVIGTFESGYGLWRSALTDDNIRRRLGNLRCQEDGLWARLQTGKLSGGNYDGSYQTYQIGMDKKMADIAYGFAVDYSRGNNTVTEGTGEASNTGVSLYAASYYKSGVYRNVVLRAGKIQSDLKSCGQVADSFDYSTWGYSASYEVGKTFTKDNGFFVEPGAQLVCGHLGGGDYTTDRGVSINKDGISSLLGRVGFVAGRKLKDSDYYVNANVYREFAGRGNMKLSYDIEQMNYDGNHKDTWFELGIGGNVKLSKGTHMYGDILKTFGAEIQKKWQVNAGVRWEF